MTRKIVVGVDDSPTAASAAETAAKLANDLGAELHVVSAYPKLEVEKMRQGSDTFFYSSEEAVRDMVARLVAGLRTQFPDVQFHKYAAEGKPADIIVDTAERIDAELIVVGNKRVQGVARVLGSIARDVAQIAPCDLYVAHTRS